MSQPPFLAELGIDDDGQPLDERALRRAYARRLKQIDIDTEPQRFQALREALEAALRWSAQRERAQPATAETPARDAVATARDEAPAARAPEAVAAAAFADLRAQVFDSEAAAHAAVQRALRDERLVSIDARTFFEWSVAHLLAEGWRPGHQHLLDPAIEAFGWNSDHARLANFGQVGALLTAAVRDRSVAQGFTEAQRAAIGPLLERIRAALPPDPATLADEVAALQFLVQRVPNWLRIVSPVDPVNARFKLWSERPAARPEPPLPLVAPPPRNLGGKPLSGLSILGFALIAVVNLLSQAGHWSSPTADAPRPPAAAAVPYDGASERELQQRQQQADALLAAIRHPAATPPPGKPSRASAPAPYLPVPDATSLDQPWWAPPWAKDPGARGAPH